MDIFPLRRRFCCISHTHLSSFGSYQRNAKRTATILAHTTGRCLQPSPFPSPRTPTFAYNRKHPCASEHSLMLVKFCVRTQRVAAWRIDKGHGFRTISSQRCLHENAFQTKNHTKTAQYATRAFNNQLLCKGNWCQPCCLSYKNQKRLSTPCVQLQVFQHWLIRFRSCNAMEANATSKPKPLATPTIKDSYCRTNSSCVLLLSANSTLLIASWYPTLRADHERKKGGKCPTDVYELATTS